MTRRDAILCTCFSAIPALADTKSAKTPKSTSFSSASPEFTVSFAAGQTMKLSQFRGKGVALEIFKTTCPHCQKSMPLMQRMYKEFSASGFQPLAVAVDQYPAGLVAEFTKRYGITFPVGWAPIDEICKFLEVQPQELYVPTLVLFDRTGKVYARYLGGDSFFNMEENNLRNAVELITKSKTPLRSPSKPTAKATAKASSKS